jgi:hypothetical protein
MSFHLGVTVHQLFGALVTEEIRELARRRLLSGGNLARRKDLERGTLKLALLLVRETNSLEHLFREEMALLMGVNKETVTRLEQGKRFVHVVNH